MENTELATTCSFELVSMYSGMDDAARAELEDELSDLGDGGIEYRTIKMPSGKVKAFTVESDNPDDPDQEKEIVGVMVFTHMVNAYWPGEYGGDNKIPVCSSLDAKTGFNADLNQTMDCATCMFNQFKDDGSGITRKACKNMRRIYLYLSGRPHLYLLTVPPTSLKDVQTQLRRIMSGGSQYTSTVLSFTLTGAVSKGGNDYSKISIKKVGTLAPEQAAEVAKIRASLKASYRNVSVTGDDYTPTQGGGQGGGRQYQSGSVRRAPEVDMDGFMQVPDGMAGDELPFN